MRCNKLRPNANEILLQARQAFKAWFKESPCVLGKAKALVGKVVNQGDEGVLFVPGHGFGQVAPSFERVKPIALPMRHKHAPNAFKRVILAGVRRVGDQRERELPWVSELRQALDELGTTALVF
jgi:hypothetical protein